MENFDKIKFAAEEVSKNSYSPYSNFKVGACIETENGELFTGTNVENMAFGSTICAERGAVMKMISEAGPSSKIKSIAIYSPNSEVPCTPCGACLQVIREFALTMDIPIICGGKNGWEIIKFNEMTPDKY